MYPAFMNWEEVAANQAQMAENASTLASTGMRGDPITCDRRARREYPMKRSGGVRSPGTGIDGQSDLAALQLEALPPAMLVALAGAYGILGYVGLVASTV